MFVVVSALDRAVAATSAICASEFEVVDDWVLLADTDDAEVLMALVVVKASTVWLLEVLGAAPAVAVPADEEEERAVDWVAGVAAVVDGEVVALVPEGVEVEVAAVIAPPVVAEAPALAMPVLDVDAVVVMAVVDAVKADVADG